MAEESVAQPLRERLANAVLALPMYPSPYRIAEVAVEVFAAWLREQPESVHLHLLADSISPEVTP